MNQASVVSVLKEEGPGGSLTRRQLAVLLGIHSQDAEFGRVLEAGLTSGWLVKVPVALGEGRYGLPG